MAGYGRKLRSLTSALGWLKQEDGHEFEASLSVIVSFRLLWSRKVTLSHKKGWRGAGDVTPLVERVLMKSA